MPETERLRVEIRLPRSLDTTQAQEILDTNSVLVVVGANGTGKTRFGVWLEASDSSRTHRISAQKSLQFPKEIHPTDLELAQKRLLVGNDSGGVDAYRDAYRWGHSPATHALNDYQALTQFLFSDELQASMAYRRAMLGASQHQPPPRTKLDTIKQIWETVLPTRELKIDGLKVQACRRGTQGFIMLKILVTESG